MFEMIVFRAMLAASHQEPPFQPRYRYGEHETMGRNTRSEVEPAASPRRSAVILPFRRPARSKPRSTGVDG